MSPNCCSCPNHKGSCLIDEEYPIEVSQLFEMLFTENVWLENFSEKARKYDISYGTWRPLENGVSQREVSYKIGLASRFGPASSMVEETQTCAIHLEPHKFYFVEKEAVNSGIPYGAHFSVRCSYCLVEILPNRTKLMVHYWIEFKKFVMFGIKGLVERSVANGLKEYYDNLRLYLTQEIERLDYKK